MSQPAEHGREAGDYASCTGWADATRSKEVVCPPAVEYPVPPSPVQILFVAWNPPGRLHFWNSEDDDLRNNLRWVFEDLGWSTGADFLEDFTRRGCYLVHAVKCWQTPAWPSADATRRCAGLLKGDIDRLEPRTLCLLGRYPHLAASLVLDGLPLTTAAFRYCKGWNGRIGRMNVIITTLTNMRYNVHGGTERTNRACTAAALRRWT